MQAEMITSLAAQDRLQAWDANHTQSILRRQKVLETFQPWGGRLLRGENTHHKILELEGLFHDPLPTCSWKLRVPAPAHPGCPSPVPPTPQDPRGHLSSRLERLRHAIPSSPLTHTPAWTPQSAGERPLNRQQKQFTASLGVPAPPAVKLPPGTRAGTRRAAGPRMEKRTCKGDCSLGRAKTRLAL